MFHPSLSSAGCTSRCPYMQIVFNFGSLCISPEITGSKGADTKFLSRGVKLLSKGENFCHNLAHQAKLVAMEFSLHLAMFAFLYQANDTKHRRIPVAIKYDFRKLSTTSKKFKTFLAQSTILMTSWRASGHAETLLIATASFNRPTKSLAWSSTYLNEKFWEYFKNPQFQFRDPNTKFSLSNSIESII